MTWYTRVLDGIKVAVPFLNVSQTTNLALLVSAILARRAFRGWPEPTPSPSGAGSGIRSTACCTGSSGSGASWTTTDPGCPAGDRSPA